MSEPSTAALGTPAPAPRSGAVARTRGWIARHRVALLLLVIVGAVFLAAYASVLKHSPQYAPDTRYYAGMALWFGGTDQDAARDLVAEHTARSGWETPATDELFGWGLVQPRVVYPLLSVPFVWLMGIEGMLVVPLLAMAAVVGLLTWMLYRRYGLASALVPVLLVVASHHLIFFGTAMLTESLTALWAVLMLAVVWRYHSDPRRRYLGFLVLLVLLMAFTRQATLIPAGALVAAWLGAALVRDRPRRWMWPAITVTATTVAAQVTQTLVFPTFSQTNQFLRATGTDSLTEALAAAPRLMRHILETDLQAYMRSDRALLALIVLSVIAIVVLWRRPESHLLLGAMAGIAVYNVTNGTPTAFRYAMPGLVFFAVAVAALIARATPSPAMPSPDAGEGTAENGAT